MATYSINMADNQDSDLSSSKSILLTFPVKKKRGRPNKAIKALCSS